MKTEEWVLASSHNPSGRGNPHLPLCRFPPSLPCSRCREQELEQAAADCAVCSARGQPVAICHPKVCAQPGAGTGLGLPKHTQVVKQGVGASGCSPSPSACSHLLHHIPGSDGLGIFNSFCQPGWNKELSPDFSVPALPCHVPVLPLQALCLGHSGFLHFWERAADDKRKYISSAREFWGCFTPPGHSKPRAPRLLLVLGHKEVPADCAQEELSDCKYLGITIPS